MIHLIKYRGGALALAALFCLFNIGLPIVIVACPMMTRAPSSLSCCTNKSDFSGENLRSEKNTSCCKVTLAAERNTTEFVQSQTQNHSLAKLDIIVPIFTPNETLISSVSLASSFRVFVSFPRIEDIPIYISSLLI